MLRTTAILGALAVGCLTGTAVAATQTVKGWRRPCSVVKKAAIEAILGVDVANTKNEPGPLPTPACLYRDGNSQLIVGIYFKGKTILGTVKRSYTADAADAESNEVHTDFQTVSGLGTKAFYFQSPGLNRLEVLVKKKLFFIDGPTLTLDQARAIAVNVVKKA